MTDRDLNLERLPALQMIAADRVDFGEDYDVDDVMCELRQLVERERKAAWNDGFLYALRAEEEGRRLAREEIENSG